MDDQPQGPRDPGLPRRADGLHAQLERRCRRRAAARAAAVAAAPAPGRGDDRDERGGKAAHRARGDGQRLRVRPRREGQARARRRRRADDAGHRDDRVLQPGGGAGRVLPGPARPAPRARIGPAARPRVRLPLGPAGGDHRARRAAPAPAHAPDASGSRRRGRADGVSPRRHLRGGEPGPAAAHEAAHGRAIDVDPAAPRAVAATSASPPPSAPATAGRSRRPRARSRPTIGGSRRASRPGSGRCARRPASRRSGSARARSPTSSAGRAPAPPPEPARGP